LCAIREGSLSAAAEQLGYTPSGMSRMIDSLEKEAGFSLLKRSRSGMTPTADCLRLLPFLQELDRNAQRYAQMTAEIRGLETGSVTVGTAYPVCYRWLADLVAAFGQCHPGIEIQILEGTSTRLAAALTEHRADFCIISRRDGNFQWLPLLSDPMVVWVPRDSIWAEMDVFPVEEFASAPYIATYPGEDIDATRMFARLGLTPHQCFSSTDSYATCSMVGAGLGISTNNALVRGAWTSQIKILPLDPPQTVEIGIAVAPINEISPAAKKFYEFATNELHGDEACNRRTYLKNRNNIFDKNDVTVAKNAAL
jgi:DNA-binding transcriptional LysR family regulator